MQYARFLVIEVGEETAPVARTIPGAGEGLGKY